MNRHLLSLCFLMPLTALAQNQTVEVVVPDLTCVFCAYDVKEGLRGIPGVARCDETLSKVLVDMSPGVTTELEPIRNALIDAGFTPGEMSRQLKQ